MIPFTNEKLTVFQSSLYMTTTAIIQDKDVVIMTDPSWLPNEVEKIRDFISKIIGSRQLYIIYTHSDFDHIIGSGAFPEAKVIASKPFVENPNKEAILKEIHQFDQEYYLQRDYTIEYPTADIVITENHQQVELGSLTLTFYQAPGHTKDSLFSVVEPYGIFLAGDYLSDVEFPFLSAYRDYVNTIKKAETIIQKHLITTLVPGHGTITENQQEIKKRLKASTYYLNQILQDDGDLESYLKEEYAFFDGMKQIHDENKKLAGLKPTKN